MLRQPVRTGLLVILIGLASFAFFLRTVEFVTVQSEITELGRFYRTIGAIRAETYYADVSAAAEIIENSPLVGFVDRRKAVEAVLLDFNTPDTAGMINGTARDMQARIAESLFIGYINDIEFHDFRNVFVDASGVAFATYSSVVDMNLHIVDHLAGLEDFVTTGQQLRIWHQLYTVTIPLDSDDEFVRPTSASATFIDDLEISGVYLFRGAFYVRGTPFGVGLQLPTLGGDDFMMLHPLIDEIYFLPAIKAQGSDFYSSMIFDIPEMEELLQDATPRNNFTIRNVIAQGHLNNYFTFINEDYFLNQPELSSLVSEIEFLNYEHRTIQLITARDMNLLPEFQRGAPFRLGWGLGESGRLFRVVSGRELTHSDYINEHHVAVVSTAFRSITGLNIGDTFRVSVPLEQQISGVLPELNDIRVRTIPNSYDPENYIELTIVGIYLDLARPWWLGTFGSSVVYVPFSVLPEGIVLNPPNEDAILNWSDSNHLPSSWFNFELASSLNEQLFIDEYAERLADLGFGLVIFESNSQDFWASVNPMLLVVRFNAYVFWAVLVLVLTLVVFLFLQQRRKEIAIQRALGFTKARLTLRIIFCAIIFTIPPALVGGYIGWEYALGLVNETLTPLSDILDGVYGVTLNMMTISDLNVPESLHHFFATDTFTPAIELSFTWYILFIAITLSLMLLLVFIGNMLIYRLPVLEQLQGTTAKKIAESSETPASQSFVDAVKLSIPKIKFAFSPVTKLINRLKFIFTHILRAPGKSILGVLIALFFILVFGWLSESILSSENTIDNLFDTTIVEGRVEQQQIAIGMGTLNFMPSNNISRGTIDSIRESGYLLNDSVEASHNRSFIIPKDDDGIFPENWAEAIGYDLTVSVDLNWWVFDNMFALNDLPAFIDEHTIDTPSAFEGIQIEFIDGFNIYTDFVHTPGEVIPIIISESIAANRGVEIGDVVFIGYTPTNLVWLDHVTAKVVGIHNELIMRAGLQQSFIMPSDAFENILGRFIRYTAFSFTIDPIHNREISEVREFFSRALGQSLILLDNILYSVIGIATQTLLLLELIYPIALWASIIIAGGLNMLLMLQNAKKAAIMRVLGTGKVRIMLFLVFEQFLITIFGVIPGILILLFIGVTFSYMLILAIIFYIAVTLGGAIIGVILIANRPPLEMLQVRE